MDNKNQNSQTLTNRSLSSVFWIFSSSGVKVVLQLLLTIILARLLTPADFGLIGTAFIVVRFVEMSPIEITPALVQIPHIEDRHLRTGLTISLLLGTLIGSLVWLIAPIMAAFFQTEKLPSILYVIAITFPISSAADVADALMQRELKFRQLSTIQVVSHAVGYGVCGVTLALLNFGVWSLVGAYTIQVSTRTILTLWFQPHPKRLQLEPETAKQLIHLGGGFSLSNLFNYFALQGDYIVVGKFLGQDALGLYTRAYNLMALPTTTLGHAMNKVLFPAMAKVQEDLERLRRAYRRNLVIVTLVALPISIIIYVLAREIILVLLGPKWSEVVVPLQILAIGTFFRFAQKVSSILARSSGQIYEAARIQFYYALLVVFGALIGMKYGIGGVAIGVTIALVVQYLLLSNLAMKICQMKWSEFLNCHLVAFPLTFSCLSILWVSSNLMRMFYFPAYLVLIISISVTILSVIWLIYLAPSLFLGEDGIWWLQSISKYVSSSGLSKKLVKIYKKR